MHSTRVLRTHTAHQVWSEGQEYPCYLRAVLLNSVCVLHTCGESQEWCGDEQEPNIHLKVKVRKSASCFSVALNFDFTLSPSDTSTFPMHCTAKGVLEWF